MDEQIRNLKFTRVYKFTFYFWVHKIIPKTTSKFID